MSLRMADKTTKKLNEYPFLDENKSKHFMEWAAKQIFMQIEKAAIENKKTGEWLNIEELKKL